MKRYSTTGIILRRVNYGEADRVITFLTPENGKIAVIAKGVRREKSKLAGGVELFSESSITIIEGKSNLDILASARLVEHYRQIVTDYDRVSSAYQAIKFINDITEDSAGSEFYEILKTSLVSLNDLTIPTQLTEVWYKLNILKALGQEPDLNKDSQGTNLESSGAYTFDINSGVLILDKSGTVRADHIKTWRLLLTHTPEISNKVKGVSEIIEDSSELVDRMYNNTPGIH